MHTQFQIFLLYTKVENICHINRMQTEETCTWGLVLFMGKLRVKNLKIKCPYQFSI